ncbi:citrate (Si)-synthase [bacterium]|nr:citrate (Si)-synthase [bacterium]
MTSLKEKLSELLPLKRQEIVQLVKKHGDKVISEVTVKQAFGGARDVKMLICDTSLVEPDRGLLIRNIPIIDLVDKLPEEILYLLLTGELPDQDDLNELQTDLKSREKVPQYVWDVLDCATENTHQMTMFSAAILIMQQDSLFAQRYRERISKTEYWQPILEDSLTLIARLPAIATWIYRKRFHKGSRIDSNPELDWSRNLAYMLGIPDPKSEFADLMRLYMVLHSDHEGGNVSAHVCHLVASALSDPFYAVSAGLNGLAGPLHGLANQECFRFVLALKDKFGGVPKKEQLVDFAWKTLKSGQVIPGYGHAVLRVPDPRFIALRHFGLKVCPKDDLFRIVDLLFNTIPDVLKEYGKVRDPYPNVDAVSGALLYHFGMTEFDFYTVLFGVSRSLGMLSQIILSRGLCETIERPKSVSTAWVKDKVSLPV